MRSGKFVIIHVDDSPTARELVSEALYTAGCEVHGAENAQDLEELLAADPALVRSVDFFVLDMEMPDMTGAQVGAVMETVYQELARVPFIIYSGKEMEWVTRMSEEMAGISEGFRRNFKGFLAKTPGSEEELVERIREILGLA